MSSLFFLLPSPSPPPPLLFPSTPFFPYQHRLDKVRELRWETGGAVIPTHLQRKLSAKESEFYASYDKLLSEYMGHYPLLDLTGSTLVCSSSPFLWKQSRVEGRRKRERKGNRPHPYFLATRVRSYCVDACSISSPFLPLLLAPKGDVHRGARPGGLRRSHD